MTASKNLNTVVEDIYSTLEVLSEGININIDDKIADEFALKIKEALLHWATLDHKLKGCVLVILESQLDNFGMT